ISQPIIGQRKVTHDIRMKEGQIQILAGLTKRQDSKTKTGVPGLAAIPLVGRLFTGESVDRESQDLMIAFIPHILRRPEFPAANLRGSGVGNAQPTRLSLGRRQPGAFSTPAPAAPKKEEPPAETPAPPAAAVTTPPVAPGAPAATAPPPTAPPERPAGAPPLM